ncbi:hypothetical protein AB6F55_13480 [Providencia hangzhouensis]
MKKSLLTRLFVAIIFFTGTSIFAQAADNTVLTELALHKTTAYEIQCVKYHSKRS